MAARPSRWALAHILVLYIVVLHNSVRCISDNFPSKPPDSLQVESGHIVTCPTTVIISPVNFHTLSIFVCGRGVGSNSIQCTSCHKWVHKKCSGIKGSMYKVMRSFICRSCSNPVISTGHTSVDIGASANLEVVDKLCYLGDMLSVDGDADAALEARM